VNTQATPTDAISAKINALINANLALHVARTAPSTVPHRLEFVSRQEAEVARCQADLTRTLDAVFYPTS